MTQPDYTLRLERLLEIGCLVSANLELEALLHAIIEASSELVGCDDSSILVLDDASQCLRFAAGSWCHFGLMSDVKVPLENSLAGWVYTHGLPVVVQDASQDGRVFRQVDQILKFETHSVVALPMLYKGQVMGVLEAINKLAGLPFTEADIRVLTMLAAQGAAALENARLVELSQSSYQRVADLERMKTDFVAVTSHELRAPIGVILGHASFLAEAGATQEQKSQLVVILQAAVRLKEIVDDLSNVDNVRQGLALLNEQTVRLDELVSSTVSAFEELARQQEVTLSVDVTRANRRLVCDPKKIGLALGSLVKNAILFNNPGGHVWVAAEAGRDDVRIRVSDDGIGIPAEELPKIFGRFYQVESHLTRRHGGLGLGLSIARDLVELHGGEILVQSQAGQGSVFTIVLPANPE